MTKRSYGSGNIIERSPGVFLIRYRDNAGNRHNETVKGNRKKAEAVLTERRTSMETGTFSGKKKLTVGAYLQSWLETYAKTNCTAKTVQGYRQSINCYTRPIAGITLQKLDATHVQPIYAEIFKRGLSNRSVDALH